MSVYTSNVKSQYVDVVHHTNKRTEFKLDSDKLYLPNFRLSNVGCRISASESTNVYNKGVGVKSLIRNIFLMDGNITIDSLQKANRWLAFKKYQNSNDANCEFKKLNREGMGYLTATVPFGEPVQNLEQVVEFDPTMPQPATTDETPSGWVSLQELFAFLAASQFVSTTTFQNLRVVIEYETDPNIVFAGIITTQVVSVVNQPVLVVDVVDDESVHREFLKSFKGLTFKAVEVDTTALKSEVYSNKFKFNGFNNKTVSAILLQKEGSESTSSFYKRLGSEAQVNESIMIRVNNKDLLPMRITKANEKLALLTDSFGVCNTHPAAHSLNLYKANTVLQKSVERQEHQAYVGLIVPTVEQVKALEIDYVRGVPYEDNAQYTQGLTLNVFGLVLKGLVVNKDGTYSVVYL